MAETAPHARCPRRSWGAEAAGTALMVLAILLAAAVTLDTSSVRFLLLGAIVAPCVALIAVSRQALRRAHQSGRDSRLLGP